MVTSVQEQKDPKCVHFPEVLTLRIKDSSLEARVRIVVKESRVFGFEELCELKLNPSNVMSWRGEPAKRFQMKILRDDFVPETMPWILIEFDEPGIGSVDYLHGVNVVQTYDQKGTQHNESMQDFKEVYSLVDERGHGVMEVDEKDLYYLRCLNIIASYLVWVLSALIVLAVMVFLLFRFYLWSCYRQFLAITEAKALGKTFPIGTKLMKEILKQCDENVTGTGYATGVVPCRPSNADIEKVCHAPPVQQKWPGAGSMLVQNYLGMDFDGLKCYSPTTSAYKDAMLSLPANNGAEKGLVNANLPGQAKIRAKADTLMDDAGNWFAAKIDSNGGVCEVRNIVQPWDVYAFSGVVFGFLFIFIMRCAAYECIRHQRKVLASKSAEDVKRLNSQTRGRSPVRSSRGGLNYLNTS
jgi:hypothetical protein